MKVDLYIPEIFVPISINNLEKNLSKILPKKEHIEKLIAITLQDKEVKRRDIRIYFRKKQLEGYRIIDWGKNNLFLGEQYFKIEDLD